jgi:hypothetical protein
MHPSTPPTYRNQESKHKVENSRPVKQVCVMFVSLMSECSNALKDDDNNPSNHNNQSAAVVSFWVSVCTIGQFCFCKYHAESEKRKLRQCLSQLFSLKWGAA